MRQTFFIHNIVLKSRFNLINGNSLNRNNNVATNCQSSIFPPETTKRSNSFKIQKEALYNNIILHNSI